MPNAIQAIIAAAIVSATGLAAIFYFSTWEDPKEKEEEPFDENVIYFEDHVPIWRRKESSRKVK